MPSCFHSGKSAFLKSSLGLKIFHLQLRIYGTIPISLNILFCYLKNKGDRNSFIHKKVLQEDFYNTQNSEIDELCYDSHTHICMYKHTERLRSLSGKKTKAGVNPNVWASLLTKKCNYDLKLQSKEVFWDDKNVLKLDCGDGYITL